MKFIKRPVTVEAVRFIGIVNGTLTFDLTKGKHFGCPAWLHAAVAGATGYPASIWPVGDNLMVGTLEGRMQANPGDWIVRGIEGELYPCKPDIFEQTYQPVDVYPPINDHATDAAHYLTGTAIMQMQDGPRSFERDLAALLNIYSIENASNTPDFILGDFLIEVLGAFQNAVCQREDHYGRDVPIDPVLFTAMSENDKARMLRGEFGDERTKKPWSAPTITKATAEQKMAFTVAQNPARAAELLLKHAGKFRFYEKAHNDKLEGMVEGAPQRLETVTLDDLRGETTRKAQVNAALAKETEDFLMLREPVEPSAD